MSNEIRSMGIRCVNRDVIKYIAMLTMLLNHIAHVLLEDNTVLFRVFEYIGYFTAITMIYFLVEGYQYTSSKKKYGQRLFLFAAISVVPYYLAFRTPIMNMLFTLFACFMILVAREKIMKPGLRIVVQFLLVVVCAFSDWSILAPIYTILFDRAKGSKKKTIIAYIFAMLSFICINFSDYYFQKEMAMSSALLLAFISILGQLVSAVVILCFYNGKRMENGRTFSKWFFYLFYPLHLVILWLIKLAL